MTWRRETKKRHDDDVSESKGKKEGKMENHPHPPNEKKESEVHLLKSRTYIGQVVDKQQTPLKIRHKTLYKASPEENQIFKGTRMN